jgi:hypothetical protein
MTVAPGGMGCQMPATADWEGGNRTFGLTTGRVLLSLRTA